MSLTRDFKDGVHAGTSIALIFLTISEIIAIITITLITINAMNTNDIAGGIEAIMYWIVDFVIAQIFIIPITIGIEKLHKWSR